METKYPYTCIVINTRDKFIPTVIDYDNEMVWHQKGQASENGDWYGFDEVEFEKNKLFIDLTK